MECCALVSSDEEDVRAAAGCRDDGTPHAASRLFAEATGAGSAAARIGSWPTLLLATACGCCDADRTSAVIMLGENCGALRSCQIFRRKDRSRDDEGSGEREAESGRKNAGSGQKTGSRSAWKSRCGADLPVGSKRLRPRLRSRTSRLARRRNVEISSRRRIPGSHIWALAGAGSVR